MAPQSQYDPGFADFWRREQFQRSSPRRPRCNDRSDLADLVASAQVDRRAIALGYTADSAWQNIYAAGVHLFISRIFILIGCLRVLVSKPSSRSFFGTFLALDKLFFIWAIYRAVAVVATFSDAGAVVNQVAFLIDALGGYCLFRSLIHDEKDVELVVKVFAVVALVSAAEMIREHLTGQNLFGMLGECESHQTLEKANFAPKRRLVFRSPLGRSGLRRFPCFSGCGNAEWRELLPSQGQFHPPSWFSPAPVVRPSWHG